MITQKAYYADATKHRLHTLNPLRYDRIDKNAGQTVRVIESVFGITVQAPKVWSPFRFAVGIASSAWQSSRR
jgi:hypothetical protein